MGQVTPEPLRGKAVNSRRPRPAQLVRQIEKHTKAIAAHRDRLQEIHDDLTSVLDSADDALDSLTYAINKLSEYV